MAQTKDVRDLKTKGGQVWRKGVDLRDVLEVNQQGLMMDLMLVLRECSEWSMTHSSALPVQVGPGR